ncbi:MAG TPA: DUF2268 domain-containing putative Zn-dependent protease [Candidatus Saccharibacteria bacterium]|nr:DUF2268 domain-containing putative Zn-dependent protease [Candidatus Saccharibacteria bacterium]HMT39767.1 DUF2268 domain-containing putative Zn-dependent protease [Candidatus Saccharibacteria bacterium]
MNVVLLESKYWKDLSKETTKAEIKSYIEKIAEEVAQVLPDISEYLNIIVLPNLSHVTDEMKVGGSAYAPELMDLTFDPALPLGLDKFKEYVKDTLYHELNHTVRYHYEPMSRSSELFWVISEGLGVVFERDYGKAQHDWKKYDDDKTMQEWYEKFRDADSPGFNRPEGWIGRAYQTGAWLVDRAVKNSGKTVVELTRLPSKEIIELAKVD